jgi:hypothetical protein
MSVRTDLRANPFGASSHLLGDAAALQRCLRH